MDVSSVRANDSFIMFQSFALTIAGNVSYRLFHRVHHPHQRAVDTPVCNRGALTLCDAQTRRKKNSTEKPSSGSEHAVSTKTGENCVQVSFLVLLVLILCRKKYQRHHRFDLSAPASRNMLHTYCIPVAGYIEMSLLRVIPQFKPFTPKFKKYTLPTFQEINV